jgi:hypothetical protein
MSLINRLTQLERLLAPTPLSPLQAARRGEQIEALASAYPLDVQNRLADLLAVKEVATFTYMGATDGLAGDLACAAADRRWLGVVFYPWQSDTPVTFLLPPQETPPTDDDPTGGASGAPLGGW